MFAGSYYKTRYRFVLGTVHLLSNQRSCLSCALWWSSWLFISWTHDQCNDSVYVILVDALSFPNMDEYDSDSDSDPAEDFPPSRQVPSDPPIRPQPAPRNIPVFDRGSKPKPPSVASPNPQVRPNGSVQSYNGPIAPNSRPHSSASQPQYNRSLKPVRNGSDHTSEVIIKSRRGKILIIHPELVI